MTSKTSSNNLEKENKQLRKRISLLEQKLKKFQQSDAEFSNSREKYQRIAVNPQEVIYRISLPEKKYVYISEQSKELFGYSPEEFYNYPRLVRKLLDPKWFGYFKKQWNKIDEGIVPENYELKIIDREGKRRWIQQKNLIIKNKDDVPIAIEGIVTDITKRKQAENALLQSELQIKAILNNLPHLAWLKDCESKYLSVNEPFARSVNTDIENIIGKTDHDLYIPHLAEKYIDEDENVIKSGTKLFIEEKADGKWYETLKSPIFDSEGNVTGIVGLSLEITKRKKAEEEREAFSKRLTYQNNRLRKINEELKKAKESAESADQLKSAFLANMSHEIRTPMNAIVGFTTLLKNKQLTEEKQNLYIDYIQSNSKQLLKIISDIIDISKIEAGQLSIFNHDFNLNKTLDGLGTFVITELINLNKQVEFILTKPLKDEDSSIISDKVRLEQILNNLLSNAVKFTDKGIIELGYKIIKKKIRLYVRDTGIGLAPAEQKIIFERFRQATSSYTKDYGGTGIGLSISRGLITRMEGEIWVESELDKGSTFFIELPYKQATMAKPPPEKKEKSVSFCWSQYTILLVEDEEDNLMLIEDLLKPTGANLILARNGVEAVKFCEEIGDINLVLMDIKMPEMSGFDAIHKIKNIRKNLPVIAQTAHAMATDERQCLEAGFSDYISKPINAGELLNIVDKYIEVDVIA